MGERPLACGEAGKQRADLGAAQPAQRGLGPLDGGQCPLEGLQLGADAAGRGIGQQIPELLVQVTAAAGTDDQPFPGAAGRAALPLCARGGAAAA